MLTKLRNYFFEEGARASTSDKAVIIFLLIALVLAIYSMAVVGGF